MKINITRPNCALDGSTILCLYVPGFQRQVLKYVPKCKWIPQTKFQDSAYNTCNVNFVGTFVLLRIPQQANIASCYGFRNCKWIPQNVSGIRKMGIPILFITELVYEQLKARAGILISSNAEFKSKDLNIFSGIHKQVLKHWLPKPVDVIF